MKILRFRVTHYKSIVDSGDCYFSDKITIFAGKNECGKTSLLEALEDFHEDREIRPEAEPIDGNGKSYETQVSVTFQLTVDELKEVLKEANITWVATTGQNITLYRYLGSKSYFLSSQTRWNFGWDNLYSETIKGVKEAIKSITSRTPPKFTNQAVSVYKKELTSFQASYTDEDVQAGVTKAIGLIDIYLEREDRVSRFVEAFVANYLPYFILFSSFEDTFPDTILASELDTNEWAGDLERVSSFDRKMIASSNAQKQRNHEGKVNTEFTTKFKKFWTQDPISLEVKKDGDRIYFWINEDGVLYKPSQRSKGQQWYLSFFIRVVARIAEDKPNVILIDEPGLFLHAKAQKDLLRVLEEHTSDWPVVFSTHSPYLITGDNLENIRLVEKKNRQTTVLGKIHAHQAADKETLSPILTAIGLGMNDSITNIDQKHNVVVEGPEDVFYLQAFKLLLKEADRPAVNFVNGGGAGNMGVVGAVLEGWDCDVYYLYDNDQGKKDGEKSLKANWKVLPECIKNVTEAEDSTIADILSVNDFKTYVLGEASRTYAGRNSKYIKQQKLEKVLLARQFLQKVKGKKVKIDTDSFKCIKQLFKEIEF